ncbi:MAG TPA: urea transporter [Bdellovibrionota bacterium]|nr:urea transporter [Bdellovibrionota bacterium]
MAERLSYLSDTLLRSYSQILFSESRSVGAAILVSSLVIPAHGFCGIVGGLSSAAFAFLIGMDRIAVRKGLFGFNGVLTGLALGYFFSLTPSLLALLLVGSILVTLLTILINHVFMVHLAAPAMSMPFNVATWLILLASMDFGILNAALPREALIALPWDAPYPADLFLRNVGAILFQFSPLSGLIITLGLLAYSRIALLLLVAGFLAALGVQEFLFASETQWLAFNPMLAALAIGGVFLIPGPASLLLALVAAVLAAVLVHANLEAFPQSLSPLAFPFNAAVVLILVTLRLRTYSSRAVQLATGFGSPETTLKNAKAQRKFRRRELRIGVPFFGKWKVTQAIDGQYTHQGYWRFAYDFQAVDSSGQLWKEPGETCQDFLAYGRPVLAPADGRVALTLDGVPDNAIGSINTDQNWGNYCIIEHSPGFHSCMAHLKPGSLMVSPGQPVRKGQPVGLCGNSGRSPYPHIHLQFQSSAIPGAPSIPFEFQNLMVGGVPPQSLTFLSHGILLENEIVENTILSFDGSLFPCVAGLRWTYEFNESRETWESAVDAIGHTYIESSPLRTRLYFHDVEGVFEITRIEGSRETGLFLFGVSISEVPDLSPDPGHVGAVHWLASNSADGAVPPPWMEISHLLSLFGIALQVATKYQMTSTAGKRRVSADPKLCLKLPFRKLPLKALPKKEMLFADRAVEWLSIEGTTVLRRLR